MIKILHLVHSFDIGGTENVLANLINYMDTNAFHHYVCSLTTIGEMQKRIVTKNVQYFALNKKEKPTYFLFRKIIKIIKQIRPDITHSTDWSPFIDSTLAAYFCRVPVRVHGYHGMSYDWFIRNSKKRALIQSLLCRLTTHVITLNNFMKKTYADEIGIPEDKISVFPIGVDMKKFYRRHENERLKIRQDHHLNVNDFIIGTVGRLEKIKNYECLIQAFALIYNQIPGSKLILVGSGKERNTLEKMLSKKPYKDQVAFWGQRDDIPQILNLFDIYVQPSLYEGLSNTILEAMASKIAIMASNVGGNKELIFHGNNGLTFNPYDCQELARNIFYLHHNRKAADLYAERSFRLVYKKYSIDKMITNYEQFYKESYCGYVTTSPISPHQEK